MLSRYLTSSPVIGRMRTPCLTFHRIAFFVLPQFGFRLITAALLALLALSVHAQDADLRSLNFNAADSVAAAYEGHSLQNLPVLAHKLTHDLPTDVMKFRAIFKWVCANIENDYQLFAENQRNRSKLKDPQALKQWNATMQTRMFEGLLKKRKTVCTGYAILIQELCSFAGIRAEIVDGYGRTIAANIGGDGVMNHSWTAVLLNNKWYLCDATWASGMVDLNYKRFLKVYDNAYFLSDPRYFIRNHYPADARWTLLEETPTLTTFLNRPIVYSKAYKQKVLPSSPDQFEVGTSEKKLLIHMKGDSSEIHNVSLIVDNVLEEAVVVPDPAERDTEVIEFPVRSGRHLVHVLVNGEVVFTYAVTRKKI